MPHIKSDVRWLVLNGFTEAAFKSRSKAKAFGKAWVNATSKNAAKAAKEATQKRIVIRHVKNYWPVVDANNKVVDATHVKVDVPDKIMIKKRP